MFVLVELVGILIGALAGLLVSRVRTLHVAARALMAGAGVAAVTALWHGLNSDTPRPWIVGLMAFTAVTCLATVARKSHAATR